MPEFNDEEVDQVVDYLMALNNAPIAALLKQSSLPYSNKNKTELRAEIVRGVKDGNLTKDDLLEWLDLLEGWGNQHVYLYIAPEGETKVWKSETKAKKRLEAIDSQNLFNCHLPLILPDETTLVSVQWSQARVRFIWVEKREYTNRREDLDLDNEDFEDVGDLEDSVVYKAYEEKTQRAVSSFDWNLDTGFAALMIHRLPSGEKYAQEKAEFEAAIEDAVHISNFKRVKISKAIKKIFDSSETLNRQLEEETATGGRAKLSSAGRKKGIKDDAKLTSARAALGRTSAVSGNFYWLKNDDQLKRDIRTKLYATDQRIGIFLQCSETEVQYVLSRIRHHCR